MSDPISLYWYLQGVFKSNKNINISSCNGEYKVFDMEGNEIQDLPEVAAAIQSYISKLPEPQPLIYDVPIHAPDFVVASPKIKDDPKEALLEAVTEAKKQHGESKSIALIALSLAHYLEDVEKRLKKKGI